MKIGYARVSTDDQNLQLQLDALTKAECDLIFSDQGISGGTFSRPGLNKAVARLSKGDMLVVWRLDRLGRSLRQLTALIHRLGKRNVEFRSLTENIDTTSSGGLLFFHMIAALAEFERGLISERTRAGMDAARAQGRHMGRRPSLTDAQCEEARLAMLEGRQSEEAVAQTFNVTPRTLRRLLDRHTDARLETFDTVVQRSGGTEAQRNARGRH